MTYEEIKDLPIYFILAMGRSGTTLLQTMLDAHKHTMAPFESRFLLHFKNKYQHTQNWTKKTKEQFFEDIINEQKIYLFWDINKNKLREYLDILPSNATYVTACKMVYLSNNSFFKKENTLCIIDKNPVYAWLIPLVLDLIPDAKFIHLIRDARGCVNSTIKFKKGKERHAAKGWNTANYYIEKFKLRNKDSFFTLRYEDLLVDPKIHLTKLCDFINLDFQHQMLTYNQVISEVSTTYLSSSNDVEVKRLRKKGFEQVHNNITKPINPLRIDSWKSKMTTRQIETVNNISGYYLKSYGYIDSHDGSKNKTYSYFLLFIFYKIQLYYSLPIWLRELKSKPSLAFLENVD